MILRHLLIATLVLGACAFTVSCSTNKSSPSPSATTPPAPVVPSPAPAAPVPAPAAPAPSSASGLPPGPGADLTAMLCQGCHDLDTVTSQRHDLDGWHSVITEMIGNGASLTDSQANQVANYLAGNFGTG